MSKKNNYNLTPFNIIVMIVSFPVMVYAAIFFDWRFGPGYGLRATPGVIPFILWLLFLKYVLRVKIRVFRSGDDNPEYSTLEKSIPTWQKLLLVVASALLIIWVFFIK